MRRARDDLGHCRIRSPVDYGRVGTIRVRSGARLAVVVVAYSKMAARSLELIVHGYCQKIRHKQYNSQSCRSNSGPRAL